MKEVKWKYISIPIVFFFILGSILLVQSVQGVGGVNFRMAMNMDYEGSDQNDPIDISGSESGFVEIVMHGEMEIHSTSPHVIQEVNVFLNATPIGIWSGFEDEFHYRFDPTHISFQRVIPNQVQSENFTLKVYVTKYFTPGENGVIIGGSWENSPGAMGGSLSGTQMSIHISEFNALAIEDFDATEAIFPSDGSLVTQGSIVRIGNNVEPYFHVEIDGEDEARQRGFEFEIETISDPTREPYGYVIVIVTTSNSQVGDNVDIILILIENETGMEYDRVLWNVEVQRDTSSDEYANDGDDDLEDGETGETDDEIDDDPIEESIDSNLVTDTTPTNEEGNKVPFPGILASIGILMGFGFLFKRNKRRIS